MKPASAGAIAITNSCKGNQEEPEADPGVVFTP
jgi:hypothetical protein